MSLCVNGLGAGINLDCLKYPHPITNLIITGSSISFTRAQLSLLSNWKTKIQEDLTAIVPSAVIAYDNTTDDPTINTTQQLQKITEKEGVPSGLFYIESNFCDWNEAMRTLKGGTYRVFTVHSDGAIMGYKDRNGTEYKGFLAQINAITKGFALPEGIENSFPMYINFKRLAEFKQQFATIPEWNAQLELAEAMPEGYAMGFISGAQATATIVVDIYERCGDAASGLVIADVEVISSTLTDDTVTAVTDNGDGTWDIVFTTAALNQDITFRIKELTGSIVDGVSNPLYHEFVA